MKQTVVFELPRIILALSVQSRQGGPYKGIPVTCSFLHALFIDLSLKHLLEA
jgi:hypothetical protein